MPRMLRALWAREAIQGFDRDQVRWREGSRGITRAPPDRNSADHHHPGYALAKPVRNWAAYRGWLCCTSGHASSGRAWPSFKPPFIARRNGCLAPVRLSHSLSRAARRDGPGPCAAVPTGPVVRYRFDIHEPDASLMDQQPACAVAETSGVKMAEDVRAEIVASVLEVVVNEGDQIGKGDIVVLLESMKMEIPVLAEVDGTVSKVSVSVGDVIQAGDLIAVIS